MLDDRVYHARTFFHLGFQPDSTQRLTCGRRGPRDLGNVAASGAVGGTTSGGGSIGRGGRTRRSVLVVTAYILIQTEVGKAAQVAKEISEIKGVHQAEDVTGPYDVIVRAEARNVDDLGKLVVARVQAVDGITRTLTCPVVHL
jgi:DNA-binding Lrp family transcriptional regulator